jgi:glutaminase
LDCVQFLLEHCGVPHNTKDRWGNTPLDEAETFNHEKVSEYLRSFEEKALKSASGAVAANGAAPYTMDNDVR